ncbi:tRNA (5-methylaminomethyl-2-thiouridine)(34)-methyltransferase MnmD [Alcaligenaceae bacterium CGII-47]|nr:tRNA (5-methylaminomethyl-2-thiouridine)(34)-methyltransferase MnmD [Alcaligenaceae bacterium CGII-47]
MSGSYESLHPAVLEYDKRGVPRSAQYEDIYHSASGALGQARHVFLGGNGLPARWHRQSVFTICETGFGLGQNFLATWQAWREDPHRCRRLHYLAFEAHPFTASDLVAALLPCLPGSHQGLARSLCEAWPPLLPGMHRLEFEGGSLTLTLAFGRISRLAHQVQARVDAFFLDGFAPQRNPEMWSASVFGQLRRLARVGATAATWCSAGQVRRDLQNAGFLVSKAPGFAHKRDMTIARLRPGLGRTDALPASERVAVIGGGLAGAGIAQALALRGRAVQVYDPAFRLGLSSSHTGHLAAALVPGLTVDDDTRSRLSRVGLGRALARWSSLGGAAQPENCGALVCAVTANEAHAQQHALANLDFPVDWVRWLDAPQASARAGVAVRYGGLWFSQALRVRPDALLGAIFTLPGVRTLAQQINGLERLAEGGWRLYGACGQACGEADQVVFANAYEAKRLLATLGPQDAWPKLSGMTRLAGQISYFPVCETGAQAQHCILSGKGYSLPPRDGVGVTGSTYCLDDCMVSAAGHKAIAQQLKSWLSIGHDSWLAAQAQGGWAGWRAVSRDHLPFIGAVGSVEGAWVACAYGSRGLTWSALAGDVLGCLLDGEPVPVERELLHRIAPR